MVGGRIVHFFEESPGEVLFLVKGTGVEENDTCCVKVACSHVLSKIKKGGSIWWQSGEVYLNIDGESDVAFKKIWYSGGDQYTYAAKAFVNKMPSLNFINYKHVD